MWKIAAYIDQVPCGEGEFACFDRYCGVWAGWNSPQATTSYACMVTILSHMLESNSESWMIGGFFDLIASRDFARANDRDIPVASMWHVLSTKSEFQICTIEINYLSPNDAFTLRLSCLRWSVSRTCALHFDFYPMNLAVCTRVTICEAPKNIHEEVSGRYKVRQNLTLNRCIPVIVRDSIKSKLWKT